jgi:RHS repeat-associated protein
MSNILNLKYNHYPFGSTTPGRTFTSESYRYGYQGSEKDNEISGSGNAYTTEFRELDTRLGRWIACDPVIHHWESPYLTMSNNPIWYTDILGNDLDVKNDEASKKDVKDLAKTKNQDFIKIDDKGKVTLDFGTKTEKEIKKILKNDGGLSLIKNLVDAKKEDGSAEKYYYASTNERNGIVSWDNPDKFDNVCNTAFNFDIAEKRAGTTVVPTTANPDYSFLFNQSTTSRGDGNINTVPANGYDGSVQLSPGQLYTKGSDGVEYKVSRASFVFHELTENYYRTHFKYTYQNAHQKSQDLEPARYGNPNPGTVTKFVYDPIKK